MKQTIQCMVLLVLIFPKLLFALEEGCFLDDLIRCKTEILSVREELDKSLKQNETLLKQVHPWKWVDLYLRGGVILWYIPLGVHPYAVFGARLNIIKPISISIEAGYPFSIAYAEFRF